MKKTPFLLAFGALLLSGCACGGLSSAQSTHFDPIPGGKTNDEPYDYSSLKVNTPKNELVKDFAYGADLSIVAEIEANGGVYYNEDGKEQDVFQILANDGVNYARFRLWNDPYSATLKGEDGKPLPYGGGTNDLATDIALAKRAKAAGMKVLLDFHYSDHWADPSKQWLPKSWANALVFELPDLLKTYTKNSLQAFKDAGVTVDSVQIGNESNNNLAEVPTSEADTLAELIGAGVAGAKEVFPEIKTLVHLTNVKSPKGVYQFLDAVNKVNYDIVGLSYYPFWHGSQENLLTVMNKIEADYKRPVWIVETSYGVTDEPTEYAHNTYHSSTFEATGGYITGSQGQATLLADLVSTLSEVNNQKGQGIFYWEPAWLPVKGSTWATPAGQYYNDNGKDALKAEDIAGYDEGLPAWSNQGWFSYTGKALPGASAYRHIQQGDAKATETPVALAQDKIEVTVNLVSGKVSLPQTAAVKTNLDALRARPVEWNQEEVSAILAGGDGDYIVHGKVDGSFDVEANVTAETNYIQDYSFEGQADGEEVEVGSPWKLEASAKHVAWIEAKSAGNLDGEKYFHWYNVNDATFTLSQTLTGVRAGDYDLSTYIMAGDLPDQYSKFELFYQLGGGEKVSLEIGSKAVKGWGSPLNRYMQKCILPHIEVPADNATITVGMTIEYAGLAWGHSDLWSFSAHRDPKPVEEYVASGALEDGNLAAQTAFTAPDSPWYVGEDEANVLKVSDKTEDQQAMKKNEGTNNHFKWWSESPFSFELHQNVKNLPAGTYLFSCYLRSITDDGYDSFRFYYQVEGSDKVYFDLNNSTYLKPWDTDDIVSTAEVALDGILIPAEKKVTFGFEVSGKANAWGRMTDFSLVRIA
ncbi:MAG: glycosyl hydrolase 53 family protein [Bacilli bacterium]|nr:glycosyl hydrolase 53 family protein [Bacilli bacterium]